MSNNSPQSPVELVIFGAAGDLTWRKLVPALYNLFLDNLIPEKFAIFGVDVKAVGVPDLLKRLLDGVKQFSRSGKAEPKKWKTFADHLVSMIDGDLSDEGTYEKLGKALNAQDKTWGEHGEKVYYLAVPPTIVETIVQHLGQAHLVSDHKRSRVVFEKPFGHDLDSARELNHSLLKTLEEPQIYRIDHYLGKETVQNILAFRFANALFEPIWDRRYIDHVQILSLIAMEPPAAFTADEIRARKVDVLRAIRPIPVDRLHQNASRGQYGPGWLEGERVVGYRNEPDVDPASNTETFAALKLFIDNWRWQDIPFYLRTGKRLAQKTSHAIIQFRPVPHQSFPASANQDWLPNLLEIDIQPDEGIAIHFQAKQPGVDLRLSSQEMRFAYSDAFRTAPPEAYETLLLDVIRGDATLFMRADQVERAWEVIEPVLDVWSSVAPSDFPNYLSGTWGPASAEALIAQDGRQWLQPTFLDKPKSGG